MPSGASKPGAPSSSKLPMESALAGETCRFFPVDPGKRTEALMHLANERDTSAMNTAANQRLCSQDVLLHLGFAGMSGSRCITLTAHEQHQQHLTVKMKLALSC